MVTVVLEMRRVPIRRRMKKTRAHPNAFLKAYSNLAFQSIDRRSSYKEIEKKADLQRRGGSTGLARVPIRMRMKKPRTSTKAFFSKLLLQSSISKYRS